MVCGADSLFFNGLSENTRPLPGPKAALMWSSGGPYPVPVRSAGGLGRAGERGGMDELRGDRKCREIREPAPALTPQRTDSKPEIGKMYSFG